jgi:hypothetical protein
VHTGVCCIMRSQVIFTARFAVRAFLAQPREPNETSQSTAGGTPSGFASKISRQDRVGSLNATDPFQIVPEKKSIKNRIQIDLNASVAALTTEITALDTQLRELVTSAAPRTLALLGVGMSHERTSTGPAACQCVHPFRCGASDASDLEVAPPARRCVWSIR